MANIALTGLGAVCARIRLVHDPAHIRVVALCPLHTVSAVTQWGSCFNNVLVSADTALLVGLATLFTGRFNRNRIPVLMRFCADFVTPEFRIANRAPPDLPAVHARRSLFYRAVRRPCVRSHVDRMRLAVIALTAGLLPPLKRNIEFHMPPLDTSNKSGSCLRTCRAAIPYFNVRSSCIVKLVRTIMYAHAVTWCNLIIVVSIQINTRSQLLRLIWINNFQLFICARR